MKMNEIERRKYLALQAFYLQVKDLLKKLEEKLSIEPTVKRKAKVLEHHEKANA